MSYNHCINVNSKNRAQNSTPDDRTIPDDILAKPREEAQEKIDPQDKAKADGQPEAEAEADVDAAADDTDEAADDTKKVSSSKNGQNRAQNSAISRDEDDEDDIGTNPTGNEEKKSKPKPKPPDRHKEEDYWTKGHWRDNI